MEAKAAAGAAEELQLQVIPQLHSGEEAKTAVGARRKRSVVLESVLTTQFAGAEAQLALTAPKFEQIVLQELERVGEVGVASVAMELGRRQWIERSRKQVESVASRIGFLQTSKSHKGLLKENGRVNFGLHWHLNT